MCEKSSSKGGWTVHIKTSESTAGWTVHLHINHHRVYSGDYRLTINHLMWNVSKILKESRFYKCVGCIFLTCPYLNHITKSAKLLNNTNILCRKRVFWVFYYFFIILQNVFVLLFFRFFYLTKRCLFGFLLSDEIGSTILLKRQY